MVNIFSCALDSYRIDLEKCLFKSFAQFLKKKIFMSWEWNTSTVFWWHSSLLFPTQDPHPISNPCKILSTFYFLDFFLSHVYVLPAYTNVCHMHTAAAEARKGGVTIPGTGVTVVSGHALLGTESRSSARPTSVFITSAPSIHCTLVAYNWNVYAFALTLGWKLFIYSADQTLIKTHYSHNSFTEQAPCFLCR